ncbi:MAG: large subunit ribosomal protein, partial [Gaiellaceae bacterium]|nr:large subunit ribosomal protein [Gaiellaceae bacterium]
MEVILREDVDKVGLRGEVVNVARGYARNYLFPRKLAQEATPALVKELEKRHAQISRHEAASVEQAREIASKLEHAELRFDVKSGPTGSLFGSVTPTDIADQIWEKHKIRVDRRKIGTDTIKRIGRYEIPIELFQDVTVEVKTLVVPEGGELPPEEELAAMEAAEAAANAPDEEEAGEELDLDALVAAALAQDPVVSEQRVVEPTADVVAGEVPEDEFDRAAYESDVAEAEAAGEDL